MEKTGEEIKKTSWKRIILLIIGIGGIIFLGYFGRLTYRISQELSEGTYDLTSFADEGEQSKISEEDIRAVEASRIDPFIDNYENDPSIGPDDAKVVIVAFEDFQCPFCRKAYPAVEYLIERYSDEVKFVYRDFPIASIHPDAQLAAEAGQCANDQGRFWEYHSLLYENQEDLSRPALEKYARSVNMDMDLFNNCLDSQKYTAEVSIDYEDGLSAGVTGTPTFFVNGSKIPGVVTESGWDQIVQYFKNN